MPARFRACAILLTIVLLGAVAPAASLEQHSLEQLLVDFDRVRIDPAEAVASVRSTGRLTIAARRATFDLELVPHDLRAPHYRAQVTRDGGVVEPLEPGPVRTYRGTVRGIEGAEARFTIDDEGVSGLVVTDDEWYYVEPERGFSKAADAASHVVYSSDDVRAAALGTCGTTLAQVVGTPDHPSAVDVAEKQGDVPPVVELATETDFEYVQALGSSRKAIDEILSIMNKIDGAYEKQLGVNFSIVFQNAWETREDPYDSDDALQLLQQFRSYWNFNNSTIERDLTHLWSAELFSSSTLGIAYVGVTCASAGNSYGLSQRIVNGPGKFIVTAHEIGHNFNAIHPDLLSPPRSECSNTIMQSFVGTGFKFCDFSKAQIVNWLAGNSACLKNNHDPVVIAGLDRFAGRGATVSLVGGSSDRDRDPLTLRWSQTGGPNVSLQNATTSSASFVAPEVEEETQLTFKLAAEDGRGGRGEDTIVVTVIPDVLPGVTLTSPATPVSIKAGKNLKIRWTPDAGLEGTLMIELSRDGGATFEPLFTDVPARSGKKKWKSTAPKTSTAIVRITSESDARSQSFSAVFAIE